MKRRKAAKRPAATEGAGVFALSPQLRYQLVFNYAREILGSEGTARAWMDGPHPHIGDGADDVAEACRTPEGFRDAMLALHRIQEVAQQHRATTPPGSAFADR